MTECTRRRFLGTSATLAGGLLAGCGGGDGGTVRNWLWVRRATPAVLVRLTTNDIDGTDYSSEAAIRDFAARIVAEGSLTVTQEERPERVYASFYDQPTRFDGAVYDFTSSSREVSYHEFLLTVAPENVAGSSPGSAAGDSAHTTADSAHTTADSAHTTAESAHTTSHSDTLDGDTVNYSALSYSDRQLLADAVPPANGSEESRTVRVRDGTRSRSRVLSADEPLRIRHNGTAYLVGADLLESSEATRYTVGYDERWSFQEWADRLRSEHRFDLADLSEAERAVFEAAAEGATYDVAPSDEAAFSLREELQGHGELPTLARRLPRATPGRRVISESQIWLVRYDGADYVVQWSEQTYD